jgi:hypothetical protein
MAGEFSHFPQDFWMSSLAIGHPLVYVSQASSKHSLDQASEADDTFVSCQKLSILLLLTVVPFFA